MLRAFRYLRDAVGVTFLSQSFITPRYITSSYKNYRRSRSLFARAKTEFFSDLKTVRLFIQYYGPRRGCSSHDAIEQTDECSRVLESPHLVGGTCRLRSISALPLHEEREMYLSVFSRKTRDFAPVFRSRNDVRPEGRNSDVTLLPLPERRIFLLLSKSVDDRR